MKKSLLTKLFAAAAFTLSALSAWAVKPEAGKVYQVTNNGYGTSLSDNGPTSPVTCTASNPASMTQRWLVSEGKTSNTLVFRSLATGCYLKTSGTTSSPWSTGDNPTASAVQMVVSGSGSEFTVVASGGGSYLSMHCDGSGVVVCWDSSNPYSKWNFTEISMTQAEIDAAIASFNDIEAEQAKEAEYSAALAALYSDAACTTLKPAVSSMTEAQLRADANFAKLSAPLQNMVLKTKAGNWQETVNGKTWNDKYARKYRVQLYEPFAEGNAGAQLCSIQAYTNMNNPTGIVGNSGDMLYVFVEGDVKDGATLYMGSVTGYGMFNNCTSGFQLHSGLNIIPIFGELAHQFIYYTVATTATENGRLVPARKVTDYDPIKIHIEGGQLNGFFNYIGDELYTPDTDADYRYTAERAVHPMYDLMGKYVILHFFFFDTPAKAGETNKSWGVKSVLDKDINKQSGDTPYEYDPAKIMKAWDDMCFRERTVMGIQSDEELARYNKELLLDFYEPLTGDAIAKHPAGSTWNTDPGFQYADYFNNRMMGITMQGDLYMNATSWRTAYNIGTCPDILCKIGQNSGALWGPAHEYGHMNQYPMKFAGTTEESNNIFSNICVYYRGERTSRSALPSDQLNVFNKDLTYLEHSTWGTTRMFLQLWLYYHACGNNKKFYPRLYELLRKNPRQQSYYLNMRYDQCHFAKMCCIAAQEDLTDFFESWGFFVPLDNYHIGDYSNFMATLTPEDAQAVKDEIAALGLPKNDQIILIDDRPGSKRQSWYEGSMAIEKAGPLGGVEDFRNKVKPSGSLSFTLDGENLVIKHDNGTPGVGFLVYGNDGTLLSFSNDYTFPLKRAASSALMSGTAKVYAVGADGTRMEVTNDYVNAPIEDHLKNLADLCTSVSDVYDRIDTEERMAGWYTPFYAKPFVAALDAAKAVPANATREQITELYLNLVNEYIALTEHSFATIRFVPGSTYQIISAEFPKRALAASKTKVTNSTAKKLDKITDSQTWKFIAADGDNRYYIQNVGNSYYIGKPLDGGKSANSSVLNMAEKKADAGIYEIREVSSGQWALLADGNWDYSPNIIGSSETGGICLWSASSLGSQWFLKLIEADEKGAALTGLEQLVAEAADLLPRAGRMGINGENVELTPEMLSSNAKCTVSTYGDQFTSFSVLTDGDLQTFFHSDYSGKNSTDGKDHHITIDLGEGKTLNSVQFGWTNRDVTGTNSGVAAPKKVQFWGSADGSTFKSILTVSGLPEGSAASYASPVISDGNDYRFWRMMVKESTGGTAGGHPYFCLSEITISGAEEYVIPDEKYPLVKPEMMIAVRDYLEAARTVLAATNPTTKKLTTAYDNLLPAYQTLAEAMGEETGIFEIEADGAATPAARRGIYDLQGRKLSKAGKGIFIINGVKTLCK